MRYAVIADVHGNYPALQAVLRDAKKAGAEQFLFLGDYMTDFPFAREIVAVLRSLPHAVFVSGNREWYLDSLDPAQRGLEQYAALFLTRDALRPEELAWVKQLPRTAKLPTPDGARTLYLQHESPVALDHRGQKTPASGELDELFPQRDATGAQVAQYVRKSLLSNPQLPSFLRQTGASVFLHGHSHLQYAVEVEGVLLLNNVLTVRAHQANSHRFYGWEEFTLNVVKFLNAREKPMVFILWGRNAIEKEKYIDASRHLVLKSPHPSPLSAYRGFFGSKPFSKTNAFLVSTGQDPIDWQIPNL